MGLLSFQDHVSQFLAISLCVCLSISISSCLSPILQNISMKRQRDVYIPNLFCFSGRTLTYTVTKMETLGLELRSVGLKAEPPWRSDCDSLWVHNLDCTVLTLCRAAMPRAGMVAIHRDYLARIREEKWWGRTIQAGQLREPRPKLFPTLINCCLI